MHRYYKFFLATYFISLSFQGDVVAYQTSNPAPSSNQESYSQDLYNGSAPSMDAENSFLRSSENELNQMNSSNQSMIKQDRSLFNEGYDPNQKYFGGELKSVPNSTPSYSNQEEMMRGGYPGINQQSPPEQGNVSSSNNSNTK